MLKNALSGSEIALPKSICALHQPVADHPNPWDHHTHALAHIIYGAIESGDGWIGFDAFMAMALYTPGLGYYAHDSNKFGWLPAAGWRDRIGGGEGLERAGRGEFGHGGRIGSNASKASEIGEVSRGSDFVTAPELTPLFGQTLASQVAQALQATHTAEIWEFGAGSGALALQILDELARLHVPLARYTIVDVSGALRARQQQKLLAHGDTVRWVDALPEEMQGVVIGNEVLDAMPVKLLARKNGVWFERGVVLMNSDQNEADRASNAHGTNGAEDPAWLQFAWADRPTDLRPPVDVPGAHDYLTEIHPQAEAFIRTLADKLTHGAAFFLDYGFPEGEYYHPQRHMGTVMCHRQHRSDSNPLADVGRKDVTAHVNFTGIAMAAQDAGLAVLGYCTQARFLMNCGLLDRFEAAPFAEKVMAQKLILEHEMGELFKVVGFWKPGGANKSGGEPWQPMGFAHGDRSHTL